MEEATPEGASVHDRLTALLDAQESTPEPPEPVEEPEETPEVEEEEVSESEDDSEEQEASEDAQEAEEAHVELSDLAEYLGIEDSKLDVDDDGKVYLKTKVDGEEGRATLNDLLKSYQLEGHLNKRNMEVSEHAKQLEAKQAELEQQYSNRLQNLEDTLTIAQQDLVADYQSIDWATLRREDPAEYAARTTDFQTRQDRLNSRFSKLQQERQQQQTQSQTMSAERIEAERKKLFEAIPEWSDPETAKKEQGKLREYGTSIGYSESELAHVADHRAVNVLRKAMLWDQLQTEKPKVSKRVKKAPPKVAKPGQPKGKDDAKAAKAKKLKSAVKTGKRGSVAAWLLESGKA